jgi:hypothetical protein
MMNDKDLITQDLVQELLEALKKIREEITAAREAVGPLELSLDAAHQEYQFAVGNLYRQVANLQTDIADLRAQMDRSQNPDDDLFLSDESFDSLGVKEKKINLISEPSNNQEELEKDQLLQHLVMILDDTMLNSEDANLLAEIQGLCRESDINLASILGQLPWGKIWTNPNPQEGIVNQYHRLFSWKQSLEKQLEELNHIKEQIKHNSRYGIWLQREKGNADWQLFLAESAAQFRAQIIELQSELEFLKHKWTKMAGTT